MISSFSAELLKLRKRPALWLIGAAWLTLTVVFGYLFPYLSYQGSFTGPGTGGPNMGERMIAEALPAELVPTAIQGFPMFAGALALLIGVLVSGGEYGWNTVKVMFTQRPRRLSVLGGKLMALLLIMLTLVLMTFLVATAASLVIASSTGKPVVWPELGEVLTGVGAGWLVVSMWSFGGAFLGIVLRGTSLAIGIGLVWALAVENLLRLFASMIDGMDVAQRLMPGTNAGSLVAALGVPAQGQPGGTPGVADVVGGTQAALVLGAYLVVFIAIASVLLHRRDVV